MIKEIKKALAKAVKFEDDTKTGNKSKKIFVSNAKSIQSKNIRPFSI